MLSRERRGSYNSVWFSVAQSLQSCLTLCNSMDHSPPGSPVHGILQARILEWVTISFSSWFSVGVRKEYSENANVSMFLNLVSLMVSFIYISLRTSSVPASLVAQMVKTLPAVLETQVWLLGGEDALEKGIATHSSILAWRIPWTEEPGGLWSMGSQRVGHDRD